MIHIRRAGLLDAGSLAELLNAIIAKGGTTAMTVPVTGAEIKNWMATPKSAWHLAEDGVGRVLGFQYIDPHPDLPPDAAHIATFVRLGITGIGIGSALFENTKAVALEMGYRMIDAVIRADNAGGLAYYQSRGFETIKHLPNQRLSNGQIVDKVWTRRRLD